MEPVEGRWVEGRRRLRGRMREDDGCVAEAAHDRLAAALFSTGRALVDGGDVGGAGLAGDIAAMRDAAATLARRDHRTVAAGHQRRRAAGRAGTRRRTTVAALMLEAVDDLAQVLRLQQAARLHLVEHLGPGAVRLEVGDLVEAQRRRAGRGRVLRQEQRPPDLAVARWQALEAAGLGWRRGSDAALRSGAAVRLGASRTCQRQPRRGDEQRCPGDHCADAFRRRSPRALAASSCSVCAVCRMISVAVALSLKKIMPSLATTRMRVAVSVRLSRSMSTERSLADALSFQPVSVFSSSVSGMPMRSSVFRVAKRTSLAGAEKVL